MVAESSEALTNIKLKIKKLQALAADASATQGEREAALARIRFLLANYSLTDEDVQNADIVEEWLEIDHDLTATWPDFLMASLGVFYGCYVLHYKDKQGVTRGYKVIGSKLDAHSFIELVMPIYAESIDRSKNLYNIAMNLHKQIRSQRYKSVYGGNISVQLPKDVKEFEVAALEALSKTLLGMEFLPKRNSSKWNGLEDSWGHGFVTNLMVRLQNFNYLEYQSDLDDSDEAKDDILGLEQTVKHIAYQSRFQLIVSGRDIATINEEKTERNRQYIEKFIAPKMKQDSMPSELNESMFRAGVMESKDVDLAKFK